MRYSLSGQSLPAIRATGSFWWRAPCRTSHVAASAKSLQEAQKQLEQDVVKAVDKAEHAVSSWKLECSDFLTPPALAAVQLQLKQLADIQCVPWGGYPSAERCRLVFGREELLLEVKAFPEALAVVKAVQVTGNFLFDAATHRDFLGAILGTGIDRRTIGDILLHGEQGAQVRSVKTVTTEIPVTELKVQPLKTEKLRTVEASMRLDAIASAGFRMSRSKMVTKVKNGDVRVNWLPCTKASVDVKEGDLIACAGKGRVEVGEVSQTKKGRFAVELKRIL